MTIIIFPSNILLRYVPIMAPNKMTGSMTKMRSQSIMGLVENGVLATEGNDDVIHVMMEE